MQLKTIRAEVENQTAILTLSRPKRMNAWTGRMHTEYRWALAMAEADRAVRVILVTGDPAGRAFCAGADTAALEGHAEKGGYDAGTAEDTAMPGYGVRPEFDATFAYHFGLSKPVIAAINGAAAGVGLVLACYADLRFAARGAKFTAAHGRFNFPAEFGLSWLLPRIVGLTHAQDILLSSRVFLAEEAMQMGLLNRVLAPEELLPQAKAYADMLAKTVAPGSLRMTRRQIYAGWHQSAAEAVAESERLMNDAITHPDYREGLSAWLAKRPASWRGK